MPAILVPDMDISPALKLDLRTKRPSGFFTVSVLPCDPLVSEHKLGNKIPFSVTGLVSDGNVDVWEYGGQDDIEFKYDDDVNINCNIPSGEDDIEYKDSNDENTNCNVPSHVQ